MVLLAPPSTNTRPSATHAATWVTTLGIAVENVARSWTRTHLLLSFAIPIDVLLPQLPLLVVATAVAIRVATAVLLPMLGV